MKCVNHMFIVTQLLTAGGVMKTHSKKSLISLWLTGCDEEILFFKTEQSTQTGYYLFILRAT